MANFWIINRAEILSKTPGKGGWREGRGNCVGLVREGSVKHKCGAVKKLPRGQLENWAGNVLREVLQELSLQVIRFPAIPLRLHLRGDYEWPSDN